MEFAGKGEYGPYHICMHCNGKILVKFAGYHAMGTWNEPAYLHGGCRCYHSVGWDEWICCNPESKHFRRPCVGTCEGHKKIENWEEYQESTSPLEND